MVTRLWILLQRKYNVKLQELPRLTMLIKGFNYDIKTKAPIFDETLLWRITMALSIFRQVKSSLYVESFKICAILVKYSF